MISLLLCAAATLPPEGAAADVAGLGRVVNVGRGVYAGPQPDDWAATRTFDAVVCVDSLPPETDADVRFGPTPYSGLSDAAKAVLASAEGRVYVHCHHGRHRGPAAAVWLARRRGLDDESAKKRLTLAGTGEQFPGLWRDALGTTEVPLGAAEPASVIRRSMAEIDRLYDPDRLTDERRTLIAEAFREAARDRSIDGGLRRELAAAATSRLAEAAVSCAACHQRYRDGGPVGPTNAVSSFRRDRRERLGAGFGDDLGTASEVVDDSGAATLLTSAPPHRG